MKEFSTVSVIPHDVPVLVPGAGVLDDGSLYARGLSRIQMVEDALWVGTHIPTVILSGGKGEDNKPSEAEAMHDYLKGRLPSALLPNILLEASSTNTWQNFANCATEIRQLGADALAFVTDADHMPRAIKLARKVLPKNMGIIPVVDSYMPTKYEHTRELLARVTTQVMVVGLQDGVGGGALSKRQTVYEATKQKIRHASK